MANKPVHTIQVGTVTVTVWENKFSDGGTAYSFSLSKSYYDNKSKEWKRTNSLKANELKFAELALAKAFEWRYGKTTVDSDLSDDPDDVSF